MLFCLFNVKTKLAPFFTKFKVWLRNANLHLFILCLSVWFKLIRIFQYSSFRLKISRRSLSSLSELWSYFLRQSELKILRLVLHSTHYHLLHLLTPSYTIASGALNILLKTPVRSTPCPPKHQTTILDFMDNPNIFWNLFSIAPDWVGQV